MILNFRFPSILFVAWGLLMSCGCTPKIYIIDRQTILEDEAAGEWPQFEKELYAKTALGTPTPLTTVELSATDSRPATRPVNARRARLYNVLNGSLVSSNQNLDGNTEQISNQNSEKQRPQSLSPQPNPSGLQPNRPSNQKPLTIPDHK